MTKALLTGGSGFVGKNLLKLLNPKLKIIAPTHAELDLLDGRKISEYLKSQQFDVVIHVASIGASRSGIKNDSVFEKSRQMFLNLAENSKFYGRTIFLGSGAEYGKQQPIVRAKESDFGKIKPQDEYGRAKYSVSEYIAKHQNIVNLRLFGVFGKYEDYATRFISNAICRALYGLPIIIRQNVVFDYIYVNDLVRIIDYFISNQAGHKFYNAGRGEGVELLALANIVKTATGGRAEIIVKNPGLGREYTCDNSLLKSEIPSLAFTPFETAIKELTEWYRGHLAEIDKNKLNFDA